MMQRFFAILLSALFLSAAAASAAEEDEAEETASAVFAGGCFWCVEADFEKLDGVREAISGYTGGALADPTYENHEGHVEAVKVIYDPETISYRRLVDYLLRHIDPLDAGGQFCDRGPSYTTAIFVADDAERAEAEAAIAEAQNRLGESVVTPIRERKMFWEAEDYHQDYYRKNPVRYRFYRATCGRDRRIRRVWDENQAG